jgi:hypothetical protein
VEVREPPCERPSVAQSMRMVGVWIVLVLVSTVKLYVIEIGSKARIVCGGAVNTALVNALTSLPLHNHSAQ